MQAKTKVGCSCATKATVLGLLPRWVECMLKCESNQHFLADVKKNKTGKKSDEISHVSPNNFSDLMNDLIGTKSEGFDSRPNETKCRIKLFKINTTEVQLFKFWL